MLKLPQLAPFFDAQEQQLYSQLPLNVEAPHPISKPESQRQPACLYPNSHSFDHYQQLMTLGEGQNKYQLEN